VNRISGIFLLVLAFSALSAQTDRERKIDSIQTLLATAKDDTHKVNSLITLAELLRKDDIPTAMKKGEEALTLARKIVWKPGEAAACNIMGNSHWAKMEFKEALGYYEKSTALYLENGLEEKAAVPMNNAGMIYFRLDDYPHALESLFKAKKIFDKEGNKKKIANNNLQLGNVYFALEEPYKARDYYQKSLDAFTDLGDSTLIGIQLMNIGLVYSEKLNNPDSALIYYLPAHKILMKTEDEYNKVIIHLNMSGAFVGKKDYESGMKYSEIAYQKSEAHGMKFGMAVSSLQIGQIKIDQGEFENAIPNLLKSLQLSQESGSLDTEKDALFALSFCYDTLNLAEGSLEFYKRYVRIRDSISNKEIKKDITRKELQFAFDREKQADSLKHTEDLRFRDLEIDEQRQYTLAGFSGVIVVCAFLIFVVVLQRKVARAKRRSDELLLNILPADIAQELKETGASRARKFESVTVMFTDFKDFTKISGMLTPEELVADLDTCFKSFDDIVSRHGLEKIKTVGDSYMAVGGLHANTGEHALNVVKCGIAIRDWMTTLNSSREAAGKVKYEVRIGAHSGSVVAGIVGVKKFAYDIWGETVNIAARMESSGVEGKVNISSTTYEMVKDEFAFEYRGKIDSKGIGKFDMYFAEWQKA